MLFLTLSTAGPCECSSTTPLIAVIVVLAVLLVISLAGLVIALVALSMRYQCSSQSQDSPKQDLPMQENVAYGKVNRI